MRYEWKQKIPKKSCIFVYAYNEKWFRKNGSTREQNLLESLKDYAKPKEYKFTPERVSPNLHWLNLQYYVWKIDFTVTGNTMDISSLAKWLNLLQYWILEEIAR